MNPGNRRDFLKLCTASLPALVLPKSALAYHTENSTNSASEYRTSGALDRYIDPLPIPMRLAPYEMRIDSVRYRVRMLEFKQKLHSQLPPTRLWGYEGQYPGPTIEAIQGSPVEIEWQNRLPAQHIFEVDQNLRGAMPPAPAVRTAPHLHGSRTPSESDGLPENWFTPGSSKLCVYPNSQRSATLWYHDQAIGITRLNVHAGLSGFYLLRDNEERGLDLPSGDREIPLLLQDRTLDDKGQLLYAPAWEDGQVTDPGTWGPECFCELPVVNGAIYPYLDVAPCTYRLRVLNGANARFFNLFFNLAKRPSDIPALVPFHQIGSDGGLLPKSAELNKLLMAPGERADLIVDFAGLAGKTLTLSNNATAPYPGWEMANPHHPHLYELMQFHVTLPTPAATKAFSIPSSSSFRKLGEAQSTTTRDFVISEEMSQGWSMGMRINGKGYEDAITEVVKLNTTETWRFINTTGDAHPLHLHMVQFQILQRQGFDPVALRQGKVKSIGSPRPPAPNEAGWKDTTVVGPGEVLSLLVPFEGYAGRYVFHCQMLEHLDNDMMRPFEVVAELKSKP
jgi:spore coat protein A